METDARAFAGLADTQDTAYDPAAFITSPANALDERHPGRGWGVFDYSHARATGIDAALKLKRPPLACLPTPPDSPQRQPSPAAFSLEPAAGLLQRATTVISKRRPESIGFFSPAASRAASPDKKTHHRAEKSFSDLADMFRGSSAPINLGLVPSPQREPSEFVAQAPPPPPLQRSKTQRRAGAGLQAAASFLGFSTAKGSLTAHARRQSIDERDEDDPILNLDLEAALFPSGVPGSDAPSAEAYDELVANASRLFLRMQQAYQTKHFALREVQASKTFDEEELEEARMRAKHLKLQLDGMSAVVAEQTETIKDLEKELEDERSRRRLDSQLHHNSIRVIGSPRHNANHYYDNDDDDLRIDLDAESDTESHVESVFSRASKSTRSTDTRVDHYSAEEMAPWLPPAASADELRDENARLKARVVELEETVNGCLGLFGDV